MNRMMRISLATMMTATALGLGGCEKRVVGVHDSWVGGGSAEIPSRVMLPEPKSNDTLSNVGNFLFGWTDVFADKPKPMVVERPLGGTDPMSNLGAPRTSSGSGDQ